MASDLAASTLMSTLTHIGMEVCTDPRLTQFDCCLSRLKPGAELLSAGVAWDWTTQHSFVASLYAASIVALEDLFAVQLF